MYCKYCGKEIEDDSSFCKHCGKPQSNTFRGIVNKPVWILYFIWSVAHLYLMMGYTKSDSSSKFFPFTSGYTEYSWNKSYYDFSEFIVYVFIIPAILYVAYRRYNKQIDSFIDKLINKK